MSELQPQSAEQTSQLFEEVLRELNNHLVLDRSQSNVVIGAILTDSAILIDGDPGVAKTKTAKVIAGILGLGFNRIQSTADLMPSDITGSQVFNPKTQSFDFLHGPLFTEGIVLLDDISRTPPKTLSAFIESIEEKTVTPSGSLETYKLSPYSRFIATRNPHSMEEGTFPTPTAVLDRFPIGIKFDDLPPEQMVIAGDLQDSPVNPIKNAKQRLYEAKISIEHGIGIDPAMKSFAARIAIKLKNMTEEIDQNRSSLSGLRGYLAMLSLSKVLALRDNRLNVMDTDVAQAAQYVFGHRIVKKTRSASDLNVDGLIRLATNSA